MGEETYDGEKWEILKFCFIPFAFTIMFILSILDEVNYKLGKERILW